MLLDNPFHILSCTDPQSVELRTGYFFTLTRNHRFAAPLGNLRSDFEFRSRPISLIQRYANPLHSSHQRPNREIS